MGGAIILLTLEPHTWGEIFRAFLIAFPLDLVFCWVVIKTQDMFTK